MCTKEREAKCRAASGALFGVQCKSCVGKTHVLSEYFLFVWEMYQLSTVRFPFEADALSLEVWSDIAAINAFMEAVRLGWRTKRS